MKKFIAIVASAVLAMSAFSLVACDNTNDDDSIALPSAPSGNYEEVDTTDTAKKEEFLNTVTTKFDVNKMFGDVESADWSFGLASDINAKVEASVTEHNIPTDDYKISDITVSGNVSAASSSKIKVSANTDPNALLPFKIAASADANIKGNINLPDSIYEGMGKQADTVKSLISNFDYTTKTYLDNEYLYASLPAKLVSYLPAGLPANGKIKMPIDNIFGDKREENNSSYNELATKLIDGTIDGSVKIDVTKYVTMMLDVLAQYKVSVSVSTDNGYTVKLNAGLDCVFEIVANLIGNGVTADTVAHLVGSYGKVRTCNIEAYLSVDSDGLFSGLGIGLDIAASAKIQIGNLGAYSPSLSGSLSVQYGLNFSRFYGEITLPSDLNSYVDVTTIES